MSKLISLLFVIPTFIIGADICDPSYWESLTPEEVDLAAYREVYHDREDTFPRVVFIDGRMVSLCVRDMDDVDGEFAICHQRQADLFYCYHERLSIREMAEKYSDESVVEELIRQDELEGHLGSDRLYVSSDDTEDTFFARIQDIDPDWQIDDLTLDYGLPETEEEEDEEEEEERVTVAEILDIVPDDVAEEVKGGLYGTLSLGLTESKSFGMSMANSDGRAWDSSFEGNGGGAWGVSVGYKHGSGRIEYENSLRQAHTSESGSEDMGLVDIQTHFVNVYLDMDNLKYVQPYIGVGGGRISQSYTYKSEMEVGEFSHTADTPFVNSGWSSQFVGGLNVPISDNVDFTVRARYLQVPDVLNMGEWDILREGEIDKEEMFRNPVTYEQKVEGKGFLDALFGLTIFWGR